MGLVTGSDSGVVFGYHMIAHQIHLRTFINASDWNPPYLYNHVCTRTGTRWVGTDFESARSRLKCWHAARVHNFLPQLLTLLLTFSSNIKTPIFSYSTWYASKRLPLIKADSPPQSEGIRVIVPRTYTKPPTCLICRNAFAIKPELSSHMES